MTRIIQPKCYDSIVNDWLDHIIYDTDQLYGKGGKHWDRVHWIGPTIYSYGTHFPMADIIHAGKGRNRKPALILVNGERASMTTDRHQRVLRDCIDRHASDIPSVIIPYGALDAAGIVRDSIRIVALDKDKQVPVHHESATVPRHLQLVDRVEYEPGDDWDSDERALWRLWGRASNWQEKLDNLLSMTRNLQKNIDEGKEHSSWQEPWQDQLDKRQADIAKHHAVDYTAEPRERGYHGQIPDRIVPTGNVVRGIVRKYGWSIEGVTPDGLPASGIRAGETLREPDEDGVWRWTTHRHVLGESVISADVNSHRMVTCERCNGDKYDKGDNLPSLPDPLQWRGMDIGDEYMTVVKRTDVHLPVPSTDGRDYTGDYYKKFPDSIERDYQYDRALWTTHTYVVWGALPQQREAYDCRTCRGTGKVRQPIKRRGVKFLSGFDVNEPQLAYFFCELPNVSGIDSVAAAYEALKPEVVKLAEQMGRKVHRQGDIFAVATTATTKDLMARAKKVGRRNPKKMREIIEKGTRQRNLFGGTSTPVLSRTWEPIPDSEQRREREDSMLLGTNHQGTHVIHTEDGTIYAKGCLWHVPDGRTNDHIRVKLGDVWHIIVKNTVPVRRAR